MLFIAKISFAQYYYIGQNSSAKHWRQINTEHFQIIYSEEFESKAQYTANLLTLIYNKATVTLKTSPKKISIILQNDIVEANAFVTLAPRRSEFFTTPPQDDEGLEWLSLLAVHEFRHVVQISKYYQGMTKLLYWLFGEQGVGFVIGATTPLWYLEGDAVGFETFATGYGRGRLPSFNMETRAMYLQLGSYNYDKASFGSFKNYVPNHYNMGYHLTSYVKEMHGIQTWDSVLNRVSKFPLRPFPFSSALKKYTGLGTAKTYEAMSVFLKEKWTKMYQLNEPFYSTFSVLNDTTNKTFTSYIFPVQSPKGIVCVKKGMADVEQLVLISEGKEKLLHKMGYYDGSSFSCNGKLAVWVEQIPDVRWEYRSFSDIIIYDLESDKRSRFSKKGRLFSPNISKENKIVAVSVDQSNIPSLQFFSVDSSAAYLKKEFADMDMIYYPVWGDSNTVYFVSKKDGYQNIFSWNYSSDVLKPLVVSVPYVMTHLVYHNMKIIFHSTQSGIDNIFELDLKTNEIKQLTVSKFGAFYPSVSEDGKLMYSDYSAKGMNIVKLESSAEKPFYVNQGLLMYSNTHQDEQKVFLDKEKMTTYASKKYFTHLHLFNLHSWAPLSIDAESREAAMGASLMSQNKLSNMVTSYNYTYNPQYESSAHQVKVDYMFWFPKFSFIALNEQTKYYPVLDENKIVYVENKRNILLAKMNLDFNLSRSYWQRYISFSTGYSYNNLWRGDGYEAIFNLLESSVFYYAGTKKALRDLQSRWAISLSVFNRSTLNPNSSSTNSTLAALKAFTPGLLKHHSLQVKAEWQKSTSYGVRPLNAVELPRGYANIFYNQISAGKLDYTFPLCYPDWRMGALMYLQRIKMGFFYDYAQLLDLQDNSMVLQSKGAEIRFDVNLLRYSYLMDIGCRVSVYELYGATYLSPQLLFGVSFY